MRIVLLLHTLTFGGAERHASLIANYLQKKGNEVRILLLDTAKVEYNLDPNISVVNLSDFLPPSSQNIDLLTKIRLKVCNFFDREGGAVLDALLYLKFNYGRAFDYFISTLTEPKEILVLSFMPIPNLIGTIYKNKYNYKIVCCEFSSPGDEYIKGTPIDALRRKYLARADGFIFQTEMQKDYYRSINISQSLTVPNPLESIDVAPYFGVRKKEIVNFCRLVPAKNLPLLIEAFSRIAPKYPEYKLVIYGEGPEKEKLLKIIENKRLQSSVFIYDFRKDVLSQIRDCSMFVSSSDREGISNSMIEAMAIGLPVICTDCPAGGAKTIIRPGENGLLVPVNDAEALSAAMIYYIENPKEQIRIAKNAVAIKDKLQKEKILDEWWHFIQSVERQNEQ